MAAQALTTTSKSVKTCQGYKTLQLEARRRFDSENRVVKNLAPRLHA
jgi:hypothetical protein